MSRFKTHSAAWADNALVHEPTPAERASVRSILHRSFTAGVTNAQAERKHEGRLAAARATCGHLFRLPLALVADDLHLERVEPEAQLRGEGCQFGAGLRPRR